MHSTSQSQCTGVWAFGCMGAWVERHYRCCLEPWTHSTSQSQCMGVWVYGCMGAWAYGGAALSLWFGALDTLDETEYPWRDASAIHIIMAL